MLRVPDQSLGPRPWAPSLANVHETDMIGLGWGGKVCQPVWNSSVRLPHLVTHISAKLNSILWDWWEPIDVPRR